MSEHPNATTYRAAKALLSVGNVDGFLDHVSESILWWEVDMSEPLDGKSALLHHLNDGPRVVISSEIHDVLANDEHLVALIHAVAEPNKETLTSPMQK